jgi:hypothetical protein
MLEYRIIGKSSSKLTSVPEHQAVNPNDPNYKETVFRRAYLRLGHGFNPKDRIKIRGTALKGFIVQIYQDLELVQWDNNRPLFVEIELDGGDRRICNPSTLKRSKK